MTEKVTFKMTSKARNQVALKASHGNIHVLAVGVTDYPCKSGFNTLKKCNEDAFQVMATFRDTCQLNAAPSHIQLMSSKSNTHVPYRGMIIRQLQELASGAAADDRILFYFSGHGHRIAEIDDRFLVPQDVFSEDKPDALVSGTDTGSELV